MLVKMMKSSLVAVVFVVVGSVAVVADAHGDVIQLSGSGTTNPSKCYWNIMEEMTQQAGIPLRMTYRAVGSSTGILEFKEQFVNPEASGFNAPTMFGSGDIPVKKEDYDAINAVQSKPFIHLPVLAGAVSFFHSVPDTPHLNLTACLLSGLFTGKIDTWGHPDIVKHNPNLSSVAKNTKVRVAKRQRGSSSTTSAVQYINEACDSSDPDGYASKYDFPDSLVKSSPSWDDHLASTAHMVTCEGSAGITSCIQQKEGTLGYIDAGHGVSAGLQEVRLHNKDAPAKTFRNSQESSFQAAISLDKLPAEPDLDFSQVSFLNGGGVDTWPLMQVTYLYVRKNVTAFIEDPHEQALLIAWLEALYNDAYIGRCVKDYGFVALPDNIKKYATDAISNYVNSTMDATAERFTFESSTAAVAGAGPLVFSVKRNSVDDLERYELQDQVVELQQALALANLKAETASKLVADAIDKIKSLESSISGTGTVSASGMNVEEEIKKLKTQARNNSALDEQEEQQLMAALVLGALSFAFWLIWALAFLVTRCSSRNSAPAQSAAVEGPVMVKSNTGEFTGGASDIGGASDAGDSAVAFG